MSNKKLLIISGILATLCVSSAMAMVYDNRFFPLFNRPFSRTCDHPSRFAVNLFFMTSHESYGDKEESVGLFEIFGPYDQKKLSDAMTTVGLPDALLDEWRSFDLPWQVTGKLRSQGVSVLYDQALTERWSVGCSGFFMNTNTAEYFFYERKVGANLDIGESDLLELDRERRSMHETLGLTGPVAHQFGIGDIDCYARVGGLWEYIYKCRRIDAGFRLGLLIPTGQSHFISEPTSVPFGGNGHVGLYGAFDTELELKEDLDFGMLLRLNKRFANTSRQRVPLAGEPEIYGALIAPIRVNPGPTFIFSSYLALKNIRKGLGARLQYTFSIHGKDHWADRRTASEQTLLPATFVDVEDRSRWASDYVTVEAFYDFGADQTDPGYNPTIIFSWDIPALLFQAYNISQTQRISLSFEVHF